MRNWVVGVDLGGTKVGLGLIDPDNNIVAHCRIPTDAEDGPAAVVDRIGQCVADLRHSLPDGEHVAALGICTPGPLDHIEGRLLDPPNIPALHYTPLGPMLSERLQLPVCLEHDAKAAALGEYHFGAGKDESSLVYIVVGTGVGSAIILNGEIMRGVSNSAGEMGHITIDRDGELCHCGTRGCVETFMSGPYLALRYRRSLEAGGQAAADDSISGEMVARLAQDGDPLAQQVMTEAGEALGIAVASLAMILDVELYIIGGSVAKSGEIFLAPARQTVPRYAFASVSSRVRIVGAALGDDGPILGCGWLARQLLAEG